MILLNLLITLWIVTVTYIGGVEFLIEMKTSKFEMFSGQYALLHYTFHCLMLIFCAEEKLSCKWSRSIYVCMSMSILYPTLTWLYGIFCNPIDQTIVLNIIDESTTCFHREQTMYIYSCLCVDDHRFFNPILITTDNQPSLSHIHNE